MTHEEILMEVQKIQYLYGLKRVIRYHHTREEPLDTESVAEHVYGMLVLAQYFLPLEDPENKWDHAKITDMILYHDIDEIETGDKIGYLKTDADRAQEAVAALRVIGHLPESMKAHISSRMKEYDAQMSTEARFAKAIDRIEPSFHLYSENGKGVMHQYKQTRDQHMRIKEAYVEPFPMLKAFNIAIAEEMQKQGFFTEV